MFSPRALIASTGLLALGVAAATFAGPAALASAAPNTSGASTSLHYVKIAEPFSAPGRTCTKDDTTLAISSCILVRVVRVDGTVNALQHDRFDRASTTKARKALLVSDAKWNKARIKSCAAAAHTGGTIDRITEAQCLLKSSKHRANKLINAI
jgi:uncharacterized protein YecT (DUF1311 family)